MPRAKKPDPRPSFPLGPGCRLFATPAGWYNIQFRDTSKSPDRKTQALKTQDPGEALERGRPLFTAWRGGTFDPWSEAATEIPLKEAVKRYLADLKRRGLTAATVHTYEERLRTLKHVVGEDTPLSSIPTARVERAVSHGKKGDPVSPTRRYTVHRSYAAFFAWCVEAGLVKASPLAKAKAPRLPQPPPDFLTPGEVERVVTAIDEALADVRARFGPKVLKRSPFAWAWVKDVFLFGLMTGLRAGELRALTWADVDRETGWINVRSGARSGTLRAAPKWGSHRRVPIPSALRPVLDRCAARRAAGVAPTRDPVLKGAGEDGKPFNYLGADRRLHDAGGAAKLALPLNLHLLRHTYASWLAIGGAEIAKIQQLLGHKSIQTTMRYAHLSPASLQDAAGAALYKVSPASLREAVKGLPGNDPANRALRVRARRRAKNATVGMKRADLDKAKV